MPTWSRAGGATERTAALRAARSLEVHARATPTLGWGDCPPPSRSTIDQADARVCADCVPVRRRRAAAARTAQHSRDVFWSRRQTFLVRHLATLALATALQLPHGYSATVYATGVAHATAMAFRPGGGGLYVTADTGRLAVVPPGRRRARTVVRGLGVPLGLVWLDRSHLVVSTQGRLLRLTIGPTGAVTATKTLVAHLPFGLHQQDNVVRFHGRLYFGSGSTCNACTEHDRRSAAVLSVRPDGTDLRVVARGLRNPYGLIVDARHNRILVSVNGRDDLGSASDPEPAEMVVELRAGRNFGWPGCWPSA